MASVTDRRWTAADITVLTYPEVIRRRPAMFLSTAEASEYAGSIFDQVVEGVLSELSAVRAALSVIIESDMQLTLCDDGPGTSFAKVRPTRRPWLTEIFTEVVIPGPPHARPMAVATAFSSATVVTTWQQGAAVQQEFAYGVEVAPVQELGRTERTGTSVTWTLDLILTGGVGWPRDGRKRLTRLVSGREESVTLEFSDRR